MKKLINWKVFFILLAAAIFGAFALIPYSLALAAKTGTEVQPLTPLNLLLALLQYLIMYSLLIFVGLLLGKAIGLGAPILDAASRGEPVGKAVRAMLPISIIVGVLGAVLLIVLLNFVFQPAVLAEQGPKAMGFYESAGKPGPWKSFLASFYGGIDEEIMLRLFVMTLLAWLGHFIAHRPDGKPAPAVLWIANILAAVLFGLGHLSITSTMLAITPLVVTQAIILNGLVGVACGWLYTRYGIESAIVAHFSADIVLHVIYGM